MIKDCDLPAFPLPHVPANANGDIIYGPSGLTKLELFTLAAMNGLCHKATQDYAVGPCNAAIAERALKVATATLAALEQKP